MSKEKVSTEQTRRAAELAMLEFDPEQIEQFRSYLAKILEYMENLNELDTETVAPATHVVEIKARMRPDAPSAENAGEKVLEDAPESADGFFRVPKVIESSESY